MKRAFSLVLFLLLSACSVSSHEEVEFPPVTTEEVQTCDGPGFDFLAIKSYYWNCDAMLWSLSTLPRPVPCGAFVDETFVNKRKVYDPNKCLNRLLASNYCCSFRGHLAWSDHKPVSTSVLVPRAESFNALATKYPNICFRMSHICEHKLNPTQSGMLFMALHPYAPNVCGLVDSSMNGQAAVGIPLECHGPTSKCAAKSLDGQSTYDVKVDAYKTTGALYSFLWSEPDNCRMAHENRNPEDRTDCPTQDQFNLEVRNWYSSPIWPPGPYNIDMPAWTGHGVTPAGFKPGWMKGEIWKVMSDNHGGCQGKDCHPVAILNRRYSAVRVLAMNGKQITECKYFGPFQKQYRYYCPMTAFQLGQTAEQVAQSEFVYLDAPGYRVIVNAYKRGGVFRG